MQAIYNALAGVNLGLIVGLIVLVGLTVTHLVKGLRFSPRDERTALGFFVAMASPSILERIGSSLIILTSFTDDTTVLLGALTLFCRAALGVTIWTTIIWVVFFFWRLQGVRRTHSSRT